MENDHGDVDLVGFVLGLVPARPCVVSQMFVEEQPQILRLTTPKLRSAWGPVHSG
jgi:hypothetical protein